MKRLCYDVLICIEEVVLLYITFSFSVLLALHAGVCNLLQAILYLKDCRAQWKQKKMASEQSTGLIVKWNKPIFSSATDAL